MKNQVDKNLIRMILIPVSTEERHSDKIQVASTEANGKKSVMLDLIILIRYQGRYAERVAS